MQDFSHARTPLLELLHYIRLHTKSKGSNVMSNKCVYNTLRGTVGHAAAPQGVTLRPRHSYGSRRHGGPDCRTIQNGLIRLGSACLSVRMSLICMHGREFVAVERRDLQTTKYWFYIGKGRRGRRKRR